jgi:hypothetical protein
MVRNFLRLAFAALVAFAPPLARAAEPEPPKPAEAPKAPEAKPAEAKPAETEPAPPPRKRKRRPWVIFDPIESRWGIELAGGPMWWRPVRGHVGESNRGLELAIVQTQTTYREWGFVGGRAELAFHALDSKSFAITLPRYTYVAGLRLGPFEPEVGVSIALITADVFHGDYSIGLLSPGARAGIYMNVWLLRLGAAATTEYRWRWVGDNDYRFQGLIFSLNFGKMPPE